MRLRPPCRLWFNLLSGNNVSVRRRQFFLLFYLLLFLQAGPGAQVVIEVQNRHSPVSHFRGLSATYHGFTFMPESVQHGMDAQAREIEFARLASAKPAVVRTWYGSDWAMPDWGNGYNWDSERMTAFYKWLDVMKSQQIDVAINAGWWLPQGCASPDRPFAGHFSVPRVPDDIDIFTGWFSESLHQLIEVRGYTNIKYAFLFTEPGEWCYLNPECGRLPDGYQQFEFYKLVVTSLHDRLVRDNRRKLVQLVGPNATPIGKWLQDSRSDLSTIIDVFSSHDHGLQSYDEWQKALEEGAKLAGSSGKPFWLDEYSHAGESYRETPEYGTNIAEVNVAAMNAGVETTLIWLYEDQYYVWPQDTISNQDSFSNGLHRWGLAPWIPDGGDVRPAWRLFALLSRLLNKGCDVYPVRIRNKSIHSSICRTPDGKWTSVVVNSSPEPQDVRLQFQAGLNQNLRRYLYDPARVRDRNEPILASAQFDTSEKSFVDRIPSGAVAVYTSSD